MEQPGTPKDRTEGVFLSGKHLDLTVLTETDVMQSNWYDWFNDEESTLLMQQHYFPNTRETQMQYFKSQIQDSREKIQLGMKEKGGNSLFGVASLQCIDLLNRKAEISMIIGEKKYRKITYSVEGCSLLIKHAFENLNLQRIYGGTMLNEWAEMMCRKMKFKREGILRRDIYKSGEYRDVFLVGLLKEET